MQHFKSQSTISWCFRLEIQTELEDNECMGGEIKRHANWKTIEAESSEFVTIVNHVAGGLIDVLPRGINSSRVKGEDQFYALFTTP